MGIRKSDMVMCAFSYGPWIGFWSGFFAAQEIGCLMFHAGGFSTEQRIDALLTYPITVLGSTPSYALYMAEQARKRGIDLANLAQLTEHIIQRMQTGVLVVDQHGIVRLINEAAAQMLSINPKTKANR